MIVDPSTPGVPRRLRLTRFPGVIVDFLSFLFCHQSSK
jgi:hypothetical protein